MTHRSRPHLEVLEDRLNLSSFHVPWADGAHLTLSFAPDGTNVQGAASSLFQTLAPLGSASTWQREVLRAFQTWAVHADLNIGEVGDSGAAFGTPGAVQGDSRFGDIRIAARPMSDGMIASASPFSWTGTTWSGDVILNSNFPFTIGNQTGKYDLYSVLLHEAGHVFGLDHSETVSDAMFDGYEYHTGVTADDLAELTSLYAPRSNDNKDFASAAGNGSFTTASPLGLVLTGTSLNGSLTTDTDADYYTFTTLPTLGVTGVSVQLKTSGLSQLLARVSIYDVNKKLLATQAGSDLVNGDMTLKISGLHLVPKFYVKVERAAAGINDVGIYQLRVGYGVSNLGGLLTPVNDILDHLHLNDVLASAVALVARPGGPSDDRFDYSHQASIGGSSDVDYYSVKATVTSEPQTLVALAWGHGGSGLKPRLHVFDADGQPVAFQVLANSSGTFSLQVPNAVSGVTYYVKVTGQTPNGAKTKGAYHLGVDFSALPPLALNGVGANVLNVPTSADTATLNMHQDRLMHISLSATSAGSADVVMTLLDAQNNVVLVLTARANQPSVTDSVYLKAGSYQVRYTAAPVSGNAYAPVAYSLNALDLSDNTGTYSTSASKGGGTKSPPGGGYTYNGPSNSQASAYQYWI